MPLIDPSAPYAIRLGVHLTIFLFALVAWSILGDMLAPGFSRDNMLIRVVYTMLSSIALILATNYDLGFFFAAIAVLTSGLFQTFHAFTGPEQLAIIAGAFGIVVGSSYYLTKVVSPTVSGFFDDTWM